MDFAPIIADVKAAKCAGFRYQRAGHQRYRDRVTVYGTAACCSSASVMAKQRAWCSSCGRRARTIPACLNGIFSKCNVTNARDEVPHQLTARGRGLVFDGQARALGVCGQASKNDKANGYGGR